jgi:hypothetical protein
MVGKIDTQINVSMDEIQTYEWTNVTNFTSSYKCVCQMCFQCMTSMCETYEWEFCIISITKLWDAKFMIYAL